MRAVVLVLLVSCGSSGTSKPAGTHADPVDVCERVGDVCRIDKAKLGVCSQKQGGSALSCASQH